MFVRGLFKDIEFSLHSCNPHILSTQPLPHFKHTLNTGVRGWAIPDLMDNSNQNVGFFQTCLSLFPDSLLVARQTQPFGIGKFACRCAPLWPLWTACVQHGWRLHEIGCSWHIRHIYQEFNATADQLANQGIDVGIISQSSPT